MGEHTMEFLHFPENITRLRQAQGLTQEVLADHIGVTKASVSKWERGQSLPDAPVLAELASFFGVTLDELVGYEPQLGREQIRRIYRELAEDFAKKPFAEVMAVCRRYIRRYGSCWPFLLQMAGLLLNHAPLAPTPEERRDALDEAESLCRRVRECCSDPGLASDASYQEAAAALMRGDAERAAAQLEELQDPLRLSSQGELLLLRAYQQAGQTEQARGRVQIGEYLLLLNLTASAATDLALSGADVARCDRLLHRTDALIEDWQLAQLHPNISAQYFYQAALTCMELQRPERALPYLRRFADTVAALLCGAPILHGDAFFDRLEPWIARMELGGDAPRRLRLAAQDAVRALRHPAFAPLRADAAFAALEQEAVDVIVCDSTSVDVQLKLRASVEKASGAQKERIGVVSGGASETAAKLVERAGKLNSERMVLTAPGDVRMAAAAAAVIAGESDPSVPVNGAVLAGFSGLSASYDDTQVDTLVTGGVTPLECVSGEVSIVRGITTRTTTGGAADKTWRELTTVRIVDDVIPALRASLRARFVRSKNTAQVRAAIRSQVMVELENKRAQEIIDSFGEVSVKASEDDPTVCLVEFSFAVAHGLNRIYLSAHITV